MPPVTPDELLARLATRQPIPAITLLGADSYLRDTCRKSLADSLVDPGLRDWALRRLSAKSDPIETVIAQAQTLPMLAPQQLLFVEDLPAWQGKSDSPDDDDSDSPGKGTASSDSSGSPDKDDRKKSFAALSAYFENPAPFTTLVFEAPALDKRMSLYKLLAAETLLVSCELPEDDLTRRRVAPALIHSMARELAVECDPAAASQLADILNYNLGRIHTELQKLASYVGARKRITTADVDALVPSDKKYEVWDFSDCLATGDPAKALRVLEKILREGEQPPAILGALTWMVRKLLMASEVRGVPNKFALAGKLGMNPDMAERAVAAARRIPRARLRESIAALYDADSRLKSGNTNPRAVLEFLLARLSSR